MVFNRGEDSLKARVLGAILSWFFKYMSDVSTLFTLGHVFFKAYVIRETYVIQYGTHTS